MGYYIHCQNPHLAFINNTCIFFKGITPVYEMIYEICNFLLSIVIPKHCVICHKIMNKHKNQTYICRKHTYSETYVYRICTMVIKYGK